MSLPVWTLLLGTPPSPFGARHTTIQLQEYRAVSRVPFCLHDGDAHSRLAPPPRIRVLPSFYHTSLSAAYSSRKADSPILASSPPTRTADPICTALHHTRAWRTSPGTSKSPSSLQRDRAPPHAHIPSSPRARRETAPRSTRRRLLSALLVPHVMSCVRNPDSSSSCFLDVSSLCTIRQ